MLRSSNVMDDYLRTILPNKLRLDLIYVRNRSLLTELALNARSADELTKECHGFARLTGVSARRAARRGCTSPCSPRSQPPGRKCIPLPPTALLQLGAVFVISSGAARASGAAASTTAATVATAHRPIRFPLRVPSGGA